MSGRSNKKITLQNIADNLNISIATVSRALNNPESVSADTYSRIISEVKISGYAGKISNPSTRFNGVLIVTPTSNVVFYGEIESSISETLSRYGLFTTSYLTPDKINTSELRALCSALRPSGIIFMGPFSAQEFIDVNITIPVLQCCEYDPEINASAITINNYSAARNAVEYLIAKGKRRIGFFTYSNEMARFAIERYKGFADALENSGIKLEKKYIYKISSMTAYDTAFAVASNFLKSPNRPDAIFATSDVIGAAVIQAANQQHIVVPDELAVVGFDNTMFSRICSPALTTISQPRNQIGSLAGEMIYELITNPHTPKTRVVLDTEFVIRSST